MKMHFVTKIALQYLKRKYLLGGRKQLHSSLVHSQSTNVLAAGYQPKDVESVQTSLAVSVENSGRRGTLRMILPPPNVTGQLHLGHALMATVQDVICRRHRQLGYRVEWVPGTDHAGIATQVVVEKKLLKQRGQSRHQIGREEFLREVWKWKAEKGKGIIEDLDKLGCILDWDKEYFTMDERQAHAVNIAFVKLFEEGLINRQKSLVNWSCALESTVSDIEVDTLELKGATEIAVPGYERNITFGKLYDISYSIGGPNASEGEIVVSTTRPETLLGDVAVAVNPKDPRYMKYREMPDVQLWHPFRKEPIPLIFDVTVEPGFGTGAVKITPAHDKEDFALAARHVLEGKQVFTEQGNIVDEFDDFGGLPRFTARERILEALAELNLLRGTQDHAMNLPICSRSKDVIEYMLREQWFLHCQPLADAAMAEVRSGRLKIVPSNFEIEWHRWLEDCRDWCISRQLWWGHQIPAYRALNTLGESCWVAALNETEAAEKAKVKLNANEVRLERDADVLDTWFSSALLPFSAFGWPAAEYKEHYPLDLMETGHDILFFWVARMVMLGLKLTGELPFETVLLNGIVCDAQGRKMSKSLGNVVTPQQVVQGATLEMLQQDLRKSHESGILSENELKRSLQGMKKMFSKGIPECGTDALRLTLCSHNIKNHFINFDVSECFTNKLFLNKVWQATRFLIGAAERLRMPVNEIECLSSVRLSKWDLWILSRLADTLKTSAKSLDNYNLHIEVAAFKQFFYNNLCDVYLEATKPLINAYDERGYVHCATLATCLSWGLQAMAPYTPYVAEALLLHLPRNVHINLNEYYDAQLEQEISDILDVCQAIRQLKSRNKISKKHEPRVFLYAQSADAYQILRPHLLQMQALTLTKAVDLGNGWDRYAEKQHNFFSTAGHLCSFGIATNDRYSSPPVEDLEQLDEINRRKLKNLEAELDLYRKRYENEGFRKSANEKVQQKHLDKIKKLEMEIENIKALTN